VRSGRWFQVFVIFAHISHTNIFPDFPFSTIFEIVITHFSELVERKDCRTDPQSLGLKAPWCECHFHFSDSTNPTIDGHIFFKPYWWLLVVEWSPLVGLNQPLLSISLF
jgi:hypothetical protein